MRAADARFGISMVLVVRQEALAIFFECFPRIGIFAAQRSERRTLRDGLHLWA